jgi:hypothetical protein
MVNDCLHVFRQKILIQGPQKKSDEYLFVDNGRYLRITNILSFIPRFQEHDYGK